MAAIQSSQMGKATVLINTNRYVGGTMTSGLGATDMNAYRLIGGRARSFFQRVYQYYLDPQAWRAESRDEYFTRIVRRVFTGKNYADLSSEERQAVDTRVPAYFQKPQHDASKTPPETTAPDK